MSKKGKTFNILVPSAGGPAAICCIKALRMSRKRCRITSVDPNPLSAGFFLSDRYYVVPRSSDDEALMERTIEICKTEKVGIIMPTSDFDTPIHARNRRVFEEMGVCLPFSDFFVMQACTNKLSLYRCMKNRQVMPFTTDNSEEMDMPFIVKEKVGIGPRTVFLCHDEEEVKYALTKVKDPIFQELLSGTEYSVDVLSDLEGSPLLAVPRERIETKAGITTKGRIVLDEEIQRICLNVAAEFKIRGPSCMQMKRDSNGRPKLIDVNPRMGGGTIIAALAGVNFPEIVIKLCVGEKLNIPKPKEITVTRYWNEIVV